MKPCYKFFSAGVVLMVINSLILASCASGPAALPNPTLARLPGLTPSHLPILTPSPLPSPTMTSVPMSAFTIRPGDFYFSLDGTPSMIFLRNITGKVRGDFETTLEWARQGGTRVIRVHLTHGWWENRWINSDGSVNEPWAQNWDWFFDQAQEDGIYVLPVFGVWADWNNGMPDFDGSTWQFNPLNQANGGPLKDPGELFQPGSAAQKMWLAWVETLIQRWQGRQNIAAWEIFSEINLASGSPSQTDVHGAVAESLAVDFTNRAVEMIRTADPFDRPVTLSLAGGSGMPLTSQWADVYRLDALDFIQIHPYTDKLDRELVSDVRGDLTQFNKPVMIGESGLWGDFAIAKNAPIGIKHAIWAGMVSGAMDARALWSNDGYSVYEPDRALAHDYMQLYATAELPAVHFISGVDFTGFKPLTSVETSGVWGAAVGNETSVIGWYRDAQCEPPDWNLVPVISGQKVTITVPGLSANWQVDFYDTRDGTTILSSASAIRQGSAININLPDFQDDIAFKMTAKTEPAPAATSLPAATTQLATTTDPVAGKWSGIISNLAGSFFTQVEIVIQAGCMPGQVCGTFSAPQLPCSGDLFLQAINGDTFVFVEHNATGGESCRSGGLEQLTLQADGTLYYEYLVTAGSTAISNGILKRP